MRLALLPLPLTLAVLAGCPAQLDGTGACNGGDCDSVAPRAMCEVIVKDCNESQMDCSLVPDPPPIDVELAYLPQVVACENPGAPPASLRAQAIAARSWMYNHFSIPTNRFIGDGEYAQVFTCAQEVREEHRQAVLDTAGMILMYRGTQVAGLYSKGAYVDEMTCSPVGSDPTNTEFAITHNNDTRTGADVQMSRLGFVPDNGGANDANRGAMGQEAANCLAGKFASPEKSDMDVALEILRYFYGGDIEVVQARGECLPEGSQVSIDDVGTVCSGDESCDDTCHMWFLPTVNQHYGYCSTDCQGSCGDGNACVALSSGRFACAPQPSSENGFCDSIPGTVPRVLEGFGASGYQSVCANPAVGTSCQPATGQKGECIDVNVSDCPTTPVANGSCPGSAAIQCCVR